jgi:CO/xanthine dehydrogenase Mo-binding subunit
MAADVGLAINPDGARNQLEGGPAKLAFPEVPSIDLVLMPRSDPSLGAGEGSLPPTSAALANAFAHASGRRIRELPMTPERVKAALA